MLYWETLTWITVVVGLVHFIIMKLRISLKATELLIDIKSLSDIDVHKCLINGEMKLLNTIVAVENLLCIYRNFSSLRSFSKYIAGTRVTILFVAYISTFFSYVIDTCKIADVLLCYLVTCHASLTTIITLVAVFGGISYTDSFQDLTTRIESVHKYCSKNDAYKKSINSLTIVAAVCSSLFVVAYLIILVLILWTNLSNVVQNNDIHTYMRLGTSLISY